MTRALVLILVTTAAAVAAPAARQRVVLADPDPELRHAMAQALAPWQLDVVIDGAPPASPELAAARADADTARFVVWRERGELVVYDRERGTAERRVSRDGALDPPTAAAAALTIKTMMRLPPPPPPPALPAQPATAVAAPLDDGPTVRLELGGAARLANGDGGASARILGTAVIRPSATAGWWLGVAVDAGTAPSVQRASFTGTWRDWAALAIASWAYERGAWAIEPFAGLGVRRATLAGAEQGATRDETATLATARAGAALRARVGRCVLAAQLAVDTTLGAPTYHRVSTPPEIFRAPDLAAVLGATLAIEL